jgi:hypothetical protein
VVAPRRHDPFTQQQHIMAHRHHLRHRAALALVALALFAGDTALAQNPALAFVRGIGGTDADYSNAIAIDGSENIYVTGRFRGTVDFDPGAGTASLTDAGYPGWGDIFVASYDATGSYRWAFNIGGPPVTGSASNAGTSIAVDGAGNVVVAGLFNGTMDFDPGAGTATLSSTGWAGFVAKYGPTGNYLWAFRIGSYCNRIDLAVDASDNIVVAGSFSGSVDFNPGTGTATLTSAKLSKSSSLDVFVAKYSSTGAYIWAFRVGNGYADYADAVDVDGSGNVYVTGSLNTTAVDFDPGRNQASLTGIGSFVAKYTAAGAYAWAFKLATQGAQGYQRIDADASGNLVVTGRFAGTVDFNPGAGTANVTGSGASGPDDYDIYVARYSSAGAYQWAFTPGVGNVWGVASDGGGSIYLTGRIVGPNDFDPGSGTVTLERDATHPGYDEAAFAASYTSAGACRWAFSIPTVNATGYGIASDGNGDVYVTGRFDFTADFDPSEAVASQTSAGNEDFFVARYTEQSLPKRFRGIDAVRSMQLR